MNTVAIVGVGQIGGSIGMALLARGMASEVVGITRRQAAIGEAIERRAITHGTTELASGVADAELVVVCTPVQFVADVVVQAGQHCPSGTLITDAGSTKSQIVADVRGRLPTGVEFIGSHPLAGNHESGVAAANADLYYNKMVLLTPEKDSSPAGIQRLEQFWKSLGAELRHLDPVHHDHVLAVTSHLLHVLSPAVAAMTPTEYLDCTAGGWRDGTRVAGADPQLWEEILISNADPVIAAIDEFTQLVAEFKLALEEKDASRLGQLLRKGKQHRDALGS